MKRNLIISKIEFKKLINTIILYSFVTLLVFMITACGKKNVEVSETMESSEIETSTIPESSTTDIEKDETEESKIPEETVLPESTPKPVIPQVTTLRITLTEDNSKDIVMNGNKLVSFVCSDDLGNDLLFYCDKVTVDDENRFVVAKGGYIFNVTPLTKVREANFVNCWGKDSTQTVNYTFDKGYNSSTIEDYNDIEWETGYGYYVSEWGNEQKLYIDMRSKHKHLMIFNSDDEMTLKGLEIVYKPEPVEQIEARIQSCKITLKNNKASNIVMDGKKVKSLSVKDSNGKTVNVICHGVTVDDENNLLISKDGYIANSTGLPGIKSISANNSTGDGWVTTAVGFMKGNELSNISAVNYNNGFSVPAATFQKLDLTGNSKYIKFFAEYDTVKLDSLNIYYDGTTYDTMFSRVFFDEDFYCRYTEGEFYDETLEKWSLSENVLDFYLVMVPWGEEAGASSTSYVYGTENYTIGGLYNADGKEKDKKKDPLKVGDYLSVKISDEEYNVPLPVYPLYDGKDLHSAYPYSSWKAYGEQTMLVVPYYFEDQKDSANSDNLEDIKKCFGRVTDDRGNVTECKINNAKTYSVSEYFDISSYGKMKFNAFVTDWLPLKGNFKGDRENNMLTDEEIETICSWVNEHYPNIISKLDADNNGIFDAVVLICAPTYDTVHSYSILSNNGAFNHTSSFAPIEKRSSKAINNYVCINMRMLYENQNIKNKIADTRTLIHESSHGFGLIDYYDVKHSGINAVGHYDMQSDNYGDWNAFSKYAVGWINPVVVTPEEIEKKGSVKVTINSFADTGNAIAIPTKETKLASDGTLSPFNEYILIDLFTPSGVNTYDAAQYGLEKVKGVRMYHVDAIRAKLDLEESETKYTLGIELKTNAFNKKGNYQVELLQKSGKNTFTGSGENRAVNSSDFFYTGDSFSMKTHSSFFYNGKMDNGTEFPYTITVLEISDDTATIEIK